MEKVSITIEREEAPFLAAILTKAFRETIKDIGTTPHPADVYFHWKMNVIEKVITQLAYPD